MHTTMRGSLGEMPRISYTDLKILFLQLFSPYNRYLFLLFS